MTPVWSMSARSSRPLLTNSKMSISGGQPPASALSQNAGHMPIPAGIFTRASKYPYFTMVFERSMPDS